MELLQTEFLSCVKMLLWHPAIWFFFFIYCFYSSTESHFYSQLKKDSPSCDSASGQWPSVQSATIIAYPQGPMHARMRFLWKTACIIKQFSFISQTLIYLLYWCLKLTLVVSMKSYLFSFLFIALWWNIDGSGFTDDEIDGGCASEFL